jgi:hypothetical protein
MIGKITVSCPNVRHCRCGQLIYQNEDQSWDDLCFACQRDRRIVDAASSPDLVRVLMSARLTLQKSIDTEYARDNPSLTVLALAESQIRAIDRLLNHV